VNTAFHYLSFGVSNACQERMEENDGEMSPPELQQVSLEQSDLFQSALEVRKFNC